MSNDHLVIPGNAVDHLSAKALAVLLDAMLYAERHWVKLAKLKTTTEAGETGHTMKSHPFPDTVELRKRHKLLKNQTWKLVRDELESWGCCWVKRAKSKDGHPFQLLAFSWGRFWPAHDLRNPVIDHGDPGLFIDENPHVQKAKRAKSQGPTTNAWSRANSPSTPKKSNDINESDLFKSLKKDGQHTMSSWKLRRQERGESEEIDLSRPGDLETPLAQRLATDGWRHISDTSEDLKAVGFSLRLTVYSKSPVDLADTLSTVETVIGRCGGGACRDGAIQPVRKADLRRKCRILAQGKMDPSSHATCMAELRAMAAAFPKALTSDQLELSGHRQRLLVCASGTGEIGPTAKASVYGTRSRSARPS